MSTTTSLTAFTLFTSFASGSTAAQSLEKRHQDELRIGGWSQATDSRTAVGAAGFSTTVASTGFITGLAHGHWLKEALAFRITAGMMSANMEVKTSASGVTRDFAAALPVLFGIRYYFSRSTYGEQLRPFNDAYPELRFSGGITTVWTSRFPEALALPDLNPRVSYQTPDSFWSTLTGRTAKTWRMWTAWERTFESRW